MSEQLNRLEEMMATLIRMQGAQNARMDQFAKDMIEVKADLRGVKAELSEVKADLNGVKVELSEVKADLNGVKAELSEVKADLNGVKAELSEVKQSLNSFRSETDMRLTRIERHLRLVDVDLDRTMDDVEILKRSNG